MSNSPPAILPERAILRLSGDDARTFLQGVVTQDMNALALTAPVFSTLLTPQGKIIADFFIYEDADGFLLDCHQDALAALLKKLKIYKLRAKVALDGLEDWRIVIGDDDAALADPRLAALPGRRALPKDDADAFTQDSGAYDAARISLGVPEFGADFAAEEMFLLDVNYDALAGVSYGKGCFIGQEVTSRMKRKGAARRRTLIAHFDGAAPAKGASIKAGETTLGHIMTGGDNAALALVRLDRLEKAQNESAAPIADGHALRLSLPSYVEEDAAGS